MKQRFKFYDEKKPDKFIIGNVDPAHISNPKINSQIYAKFYIVHKYKPSNIKAVKAAAEDKLKSPNNMLANIVAREIYKAKPGSKMPDIYQSLRVDNKLAGYNEVNTVPGLKSSILSSINSLPYSPQSKQTLIDLLERKIKESQGEIPSPSPTPGPQPQPEPSPFTSDNLYSSDFAALNEELIKLMATPKDESYLNNFPAKLSGFNKKLEASLQSGNISRTQYDSMMLDLRMAEAEYNAILKKY